jgi:putative transposase
MTQYLRRCYGSGTLHFVTCSCYRRRPLLGSARSRDVFVRILEETRVRYQFAVIGYIVMPEHFHLLIGEPKVGTPATVLQVLKQRVSRTLRGQKRHAGSPLQPGLGPDEHAALKSFWEPRFYDFNVWSRKKKIEKIDYMHENPLKRGLVTHPKDWRWSSFANYQGLSTTAIQIDAMG